MRIGTVRLGALVAAVGLSGAVLAAESRTYGTGEAPPQSGIHVAEPKEEAQGEPSAQSQEAAKPAQKSAQTSAQTPQTQPQPWAYRTQTGVHYGSSLQKSGDGTRRYTTSPNYGWSTQGSGVGTPPTNVTNVYGGGAYPYGSPYAWPGGACPWPMGNYNGLPSYIRVPTGQGQEMYLPMNGLWNNCQNPGTAVPPVPPAPPPAAPK